MGVDHLLYIPGILLIGLAIGFRVGASAARSEIARREQDRRR